MRRRATKLVLVVVLGAIINIAVALGIGLGTHWDHIGGNQLDRAAALAILRQRFGDGVVREDAQVSALRVKRFGCTMTRAVTLPKHDHYVQVFEFGIPMRAMSGALAVSDPKTVDQSVLVVRPIWPGFAINTIFYAAVLWLVFATPGMVKHRLRRVRGRCLHCGYDLRGQPPESHKCPECGGGSPLPRGEGSGVRARAEAGCP